MSTWHVITRDDLKRYIVDPQLSAILTAALGSGQDDPFTETMQDRCNYVRSRISGRVTLSQTPYAVPPELVQAAALLVIESLFIRLAIGMAMTEDQVRMIARAYRDLDIAGTSDLAISIADDAVAPNVASNAGGVTVVRRPAGVHTRSDYEGL